MSIRDALNEVKATHGAPGEVADPVIKGSNKRPLDATGKSDPAPTVPEPELMAPTKGKAPNPTAGSGIREWTTVLTGLKDVELAEVYSAIFTDKEVSEDFTSVEAIKEIMENVSALSEEDLTELSKKVLGNYVNKASADRANAKQVRGLMHKDETILNATAKVAKKRGQGINAAVKKLTKEDLAPAFEGTELSEEIQEKIATIFEAAVTLRVNTIAEELEVAYEETFAEEIEAYVTEAEVRVADYISTATEKWIEENKLEIESSFNVGVAESFMEGLKTLLDEHYVEVPADKVDMVEELANRVEELEDKLNAALNENIEISKELTKTEAETVVSEFAESLTAIQGEKLALLAEGIEYTSIDEFKNKLEILKESYFPAVKPATPALNEEGALEDGSVETVTNVDPAIAALAKSLNQFKN